MLASRVRAAAEMREKRMENSRERLREEKKKREQF
jgi:hypothetical protein